MLKWLASLLQSPSTTDTEPAAEVASAPDAAATLEGLFVEALREEGFMCREAADGIVMDNGLVFTLEYLESQPIGENACEQYPKSAASIRCISRRACTNSSTRVAAPR
jgi:hypothetical protein